MSKIYDVFISHSSEDRKLAVALCHFMEERGIRCWMAPRDIQVGKDYAESIIDAIQKSSIMVVIFSKLANESLHVKNEVERAFKHQLIIMPFRTQNIIPTQSLEYFLSSKHWLDAIDGNAENYFEELYRNCKTLIAQLNTQNNKAEKEIEIGHADSPLMSANPSFISRKKNPVSVPLIIIVSVILCTIAVMVYARFNKMATNNIATVSETDTVNHRKKADSILQPHIVKPPTTLDNTTVKGEPNSDNIGLKPPPVISEKAYNVAEVQSNVAALDGIAYIDAESTDNLSFVYAGKNRILFTGKAAGYQISGTLKYLRNMAFQAIEGDVTGILTFSDNTNTISGNFIIKESKLAHRMQLVRKIAL